MTTKPWVPYVNTIKDKSVVPLAHYADPARRFDAFDLTGAIIESGDWILVDCGGGFSPAVPAEPYRVCPECEAKRGPNSVLVMVDSSWNKDPERFAEMVKNS